MPQVSSSSPRLYTVIAIAVSALVMVVAFTFVEPPPPDSLRIAAGSPGGAYHAFAERYREILARSGLNLEVIETAGSVENLRLLTDDEDPVEVALLQGGVLNEDPGGLVALASVFVEPLWVFYRLPRSPRFLSDLAGLRLAVGAEGSGTRRLALHLLGQNGVGAVNAELLDMPSQEAAAALRAGEVDVVFYVANASARLVQDLLRAPGVRLMNLTRAEAYSQRDHAMATTILHAGAIDLALGIPDEDVELLAPTASVIAREDIHPALVSMLLQAMQEAHKEGGLFEVPEAYPAPERLILNSHDEADRFFRSGPALPAARVAFLDRQLGRSLDRPRDPAAHPDHPADQGAAAGLSLAHAGEGEPPLCLLGEARGRLWHGQRGGGGGPERARSNRNRGRGVGAAGRLCQ